MARQLAAIKLRSMWGALRAQTYVLVLSLIAYVYGFFMVGMAVIGLVALGILGSELTPPVLTGVGSLYTLGWILVPIIMASQDGTLDPIKLTPYTSNSRKLAISLVLAGAVGVGGIYFLMVQIGLIVSWTIFAGGTGLWSSILGSVLGSVLAMVWFKAMGTWLGKRKVTSNSAKERRGIIVGLLFVLVFIPLLYLVPLLMQNLDFDALISGFLYLKWTPFGAPWGLAGAASSGDWLGFIVMLLISFATIALGWWLLRSQLGPAMVGRKGPISAEAEAAIREGRSLINPDEETRQVPGDANSPRYLPGVEKWEAIGLSGPTAAVAERTKIYWIRDSRLTFSLSSVLMIVIMAVILDLGLLNRNMSESANLAMPGSFLILLGAFVLGQVAGTLLQYDSTAFWLHVSTGISGFRDRLGRFVPTAIIMIILLAISIVIYGTISGKTWTTIGYMMVGSLLLFACCTAATTVIGSQWVYPVQPPGTSPMSTKGTGQFGITMLVGMLQMLAGIVIAAPPGVFLIWAYATEASWAIFASLFALLWSIGMSFLGVWLGGRILDRSEVEVLTKIRSWPGHGVTA